MEKRIRLLFTVGLEFIDDVDNDISFDYDLTQEEFDKLVEIEAKQLWNTKSDSWNNIEFYFPELYKKLKTKTIEEGFRKWGDKFNPPVDSRNAYDFFIPDEIYDVVVKTDEYKKYVKARKRMSKISTRRWHQESDWILREINNGRWPSADKNHSGVFSKGGKKTNYVITVCDVSYEKYYTLRSSEIRIRVSSSCSEEYVQKLMKICFENSSRIMTCQFIDGSAWILSCKAHEDNSDIKLFAYLLDYMLA